MVDAYLEKRNIPTYPVGAPEKYPVFFKKRVYQGSSGKVYPVPFIDKVYDQSESVAYQAAVLENDTVRLVMLPEIGGRIFIGQDKTNADYDFFYRQDVIKPALVGLAGPWMSGGVEFNWPQHHRPGTFMPADVHIEHEPDGAATVWMSEHDPISRMKGMHGVRLRPDSSLIELRVRLYNRTPQVQTFLWWANVAAEVHDQYMSFFPDDVTYVADHAVRATSSFPLARNPYYGIQYQERPEANDLRWYKNIPVPTSYMVCQTNFDFFGGYDFAKQGGFVHVANRHIAPGKKQWTWGADAFGRAWDQELTDAGGPYVELMAGVYTDNQPDFSYLLPYETKTFSQYWWPIQDIGPVQQANQRAALAFRLTEDRHMEVGLCVSQAFDGVFEIHQRGQLLGRKSIAIKPGEPWTKDFGNFSGEKACELSVTLRTADGQVVLQYRPPDPDEASPRRATATEPPQPKDTPSTEELFLTGEHLEQYRHPTRDPEPYWEEALARDPDDSRCRIALGKRALRRGQLAAAREHFEAAIRRLTSRHPNPVTGEASYHLGLVLRMLGEQAAAYAALFKATWNYEWRSSAYYQLACINCVEQDWTAALQHVEASLDTNRQHNKAHVLKALVLQQSNDGQASIQAAKDTLMQLLQTDPLDHWARHAANLLNGASDAGATQAFLETTRNDAQTMLDLAFDYAEAGFVQHAADLLELHHSSETTQVAVPNPLERSPMSHYTLAWLKSRLSCDGTDQALDSARQQPADYMFPSRLEEMIVLEWALTQAPADPLAAYGLGNFYYDRRRHTDAMAVWRQAASTETKIPQVYRNLGIASWNYDRDGSAAANWYVQALELDPTNPRLVCESDQLAKKRNQTIDERLAFLEQHRELVNQRDDATVELASLYNLKQQPLKALRLVTARNFHPWEGGEGAVLRQYTCSHLLLGQAALANGHPNEAFKHFTQAMDTPDSLGEAYHPLQAKADVNYWLGRSLASLGHTEQARDRYQKSADETGDFSEMAITTHSPLSYYRGLSLLELGRKDEANRLFHSLREFGETTLSQPASIDYFATSLPNLLVFDEDLQARRDADCHLLIALAWHGLGDNDLARSHLEKALSFDCSNQQAANLDRQLWQAEAGE